MGSMLQVVYSFVHMVAVWYLMCVWVCPGRGAVESVNQSSAPHREAEAVADL